MSSLQERIRTMVNRYTDPTNIPDAIRMLAEASVEITRLNEQVQTFAQESPVVAPEFLDNPNPPEFSFWYTNHRGEVAERCVIPIALRYGTSPYYEGPHWLLQAYDMDKQAEREFALIRITDREPLFNKMDAGSAERYFLALDELAGVTKAIARALRHGPDSANPKIGDGITNRVLLANELGRLAHATDRLGQYGDIKPEVFTEARNRSTTRLRPFLHHQRPTEED